MKTINAPTHHRYESPQMEVVVIENSGAMLQTSPLEGKGMLPPTGNNKSDFDW